MHLSGCSRSSSRVRSGPVCAGPVWAGPARADPGRAGPGRAGPGRARSPPRPGAVCPGHRRARRPLPRGTGRLCATGAFFARPVTAGQRLIAVGEEKLSLSERSLILVKPDGVRRGLVGDVITRLERKGMRIVALELRNLERSTAEV